MIEVSLLFSILSGIFIFWGYFVYNEDIFRDVSSPNVTTWGIWTTTSLINTTSYFSMTTDFFKVIVPLIEIIACLFTFLYALSHKKNIASISTTDIFTLIIGTISIFVWWLFRSATFANMIVQIAFIAGFAATYTSTWNNPNSEKAFPWILFSFSYAFLLITVILRWSRTIPELVFPILGTATHFGLVFLIIFRTKFLKRITPAT